MNKPQPRVTEVNRPFWEGVNAGRIVLQHCLNPECGRVIFYPRVCCPYCHRGEMEWRQVQGEGRIVSHTTVHRVHHDGFAGEAPYVFAAVELAGGALLYGQLAGAPTEAVSLVGRAVAAEFVDHGPDRRLIRFRLASD